MTQEEKELLLKDLCARLPYDVKVCIKLPNHQEKTFEKQIGDLKEITRYGGYLVNSKGIDYRSFNLDIKPYLRPMSSMTKKEFENLKEYSELKYEQLDLASFQNGTYKCLDFYLSEVPSYVVILVFDWLNTHHFDYRGLIERGLALEAPVNMYKIG